jgi:alpha-ketoglutarate-dependent taurine dioxygenase
MDLDPNLLKDLLLEYGVIALRNFDFSLDSFTKLVKDISSKVTIDPARTFHTDVAQKVDAGINPVGLHIENGNSPFVSDLAWFYCEHEAKKGSQTTYCDGMKLWQNFPDSLKEKFKGKELLYVRNVSENHWKEFMKFHLQKDNIEFKHLLDFVKDMNVDIKLNKDQSIQYAYNTSPTITNNQGSTSFANSILGPSYNYEKPRIYLDNVEIDEKLLSQVEELTKKYTHDWFWEKGDILIIDNKRVMHGRRKIEDKKRKIFNALSYI